jgi:hypothetical protein
MSPTSQSSAWWHVARKAAVHDALLVQQIEEVLSNLRFAIKRKPWNYCQSISEVGILLCSKEMAYVPYTTRSGLSFLTATYSEASHRTFYTSFIKGCSKTIWLSGVPK